MLSLCLSLTLELSLFVVSCFYCGSLSRSFVVPLGVCFRDCWLRQAVWDVFGSRSGIESSKVQKTLNVIQIWSPNGTPFWHLGGPKWGPGGQSCAGMLKCRVFVCLCASGMLECCVFVCFFEAEMLKCCVFVFVHAFVVPSGCGMLKCCVFTCFLEAGYTPRWAKRPISPQNPKVFVCTLGKC